MPELPKTERNEELNTLLLQKQITWLRTEWALSSNECNNTWIDAVNNWDKEFKNTMRERYGSTKLAQEVPVYQVLIGGSVEDWPTIKDEDRLFIEKEVNNFVLDFSTSHQIELPE